MLTKFALSNQFKFHVFSFLIREIANVVGNFSANGLGGPSTVHTV
jgi:hypothetical protein